MKNKLLIILIICLLTACDSGEWWGNRKIKKIESDDGYLIEMQYDKEGRLSHYRSSYTSPHGYDKGKQHIFYDVTFTYYDTVALMKGITPYNLQIWEETQYLYTETTYRLNKDGLAISASLVCPQFNDSLQTRHRSLYLPQLTNFSYRNNQLSNINFEEGGHSNIESDYDIYFKNNNFEYDHSNSWSPGGVIFVNQYVYYNEQKNRSCLIGALEEYIDFHIPAFYARLLGRPSKDLVRMHASTRTGTQIVSEYEYEYDQEKYVQKMNISTSSNVLLFNSDPYASMCEYTITYSE